VSSYRLLGKKPERYDPRTILLHTVATKEPSWVPTSLDNSGAIQPALLDNARLGDCVEAGCMNGETLWAALATEPPVTFTDSQADALYTEWAGYDPNVPGEGPGTDVLSALNKWRKAPIGPNLHPLGAFTGVGPGWTPYAVTLSGWAAVCIELPQAAQTMEGLWDLPSGILDPDWAPIGPWAPGSWGGHFVPVVGFDATGVPLFTWGQKWRMTWRFWNTYVSNVYCPLSHDMLDPKNAAPNGLNSLALLAALAELGPVNPSE
jgi:hypothetical protein